MAPEAAADPQQATKKKEMQTEKAIEQQDSASQGALLAENLQASQAAAQFTIFGQTQEAINGELRV